MDVLVRTNDWEMWARDSQTKKKPLSKKLLIFSRDLFDTVDINSGRKRKKDRQGKRVSVQNSDHNISNYFMAILTFILIRIGGIDSLSLDSLVNANVRMYWF